MPGGIGLIGRTLFVAGGDPAEVFKFIEEAFRAVARLYLILFKCIVLGQGLVERFKLRAVAGLPRRQLNDGRMAFTQTGHMNFGGQPASRGPAETCGCHIGYVHRPGQEWDALFGSGLLERIPAAWPAVDPRFARTPAAVAP